MVVKCSSLNGNGMRETRKERKDFKFGHQSEFCLSAENYRRFLCLRMSVRELLVVSLVFEKTYKSMIGSFEGFQDCGSANRGFELLEAWESPELLGSEYETYLS